jgi:hypothetical protein
MQTSRRYAAVLVSLAAAAVVGLAGPAGASTSAQGTYDAALKIAGSEGVHYVSTAKEQGVSIKVVGDTGKSSGSQTLSVHKGTLTETLTVTLIGSTGYVKGNTPALLNVLGLTATQSGKYNGKWLYFPSNSATLSELVTGLRQKDVPKELKMSGPFTFGPSKTIAGQKAKSIRGSVSSSSGGKVPVVLYVASGSAPVEEVTNPGATGTAITGVVTFTKLGEKVHFSTPAHASSLLALAPAAASGATTTTTTAG